MTKYNLSLDNPSPLLSYAPPTQWIPITSQIDQYADQYGNDSTASATSHIGASVSLGFRGTGIWIYGAKRDTHGYYNVTLDNDTRTLNGYASPNEFQQLLFGASNLNLSDHTIQLINAGPLGGGPGGAWLDIDWLTWETVFVGPGGPEGAQVANSTFRENHPRFQYIPSDAWITKEYTDGKEINGSSSYTTGSDASVQFTFAGDAVGLYGSINGSISANVDGMSSMSLNSVYNASSYQQLLYYAENLGAGAHTLTIVNAPESTSTAKSTFAVDFARTWTAQGGSDSNTTTTHTPHGFHIGSFGPIIGGAVAGIVFILTLITVVIFVRKRRKSVPSFPGDRDQNRLFGPLFKRGSTFKPRNFQPHQNALTRDRSQTSVKSGTSYLSSTSNNPLLSDSHPPQTASEWCPDFIPMPQIRNSNPNISSETSEAPKHTPSSVPSSRITPTASITTPPMPTDSIP